VSDEFNDDELHDLEPPPSPYARYDIPGTVWDVQVTEFGRTLGTTVDDEPCPEVRGTLLKDSIDGRAASSEVIITGGPKLLKDLLSQADFQPGQRAVITYVGQRTIRGGKTVKDFRVQASKVTYKDLGV
jgi:hypothetical protein